MFRHLPLTIPSCCFCLRMATRLQYRSSHAWVPVCEHTFKPILLSYNIQMQNLSNILRVGCVNLTNKKLGPSNFITTAVTTFQKNQVPRFFSTHPHILFPNLAPKTWFTQLAPRWCIPSFQLGSWGPSWCWQCWRLCATGCCTTGWKLCWGTQRPYCTGDATKSIKDPMWRWVLLVRYYRLFVILLRFDVLKFWFRIFWHTAMKRNLKVSGFEMANVSSLVRNGFTVTVYTVFMEGWSSKKDINERLFSPNCARYAPVSMSILCLISIFLNEVVFLICQRIHGWTSSGSTASFGSHVWHHVTMPWHELLQKVSMILFIIFTQYIIN